MGGMSKRSSFENVEKQRTLIKPPLLLTHFPAISVAGGLRPSFSYTHAKHALANVSIDKEFIFTVRISIV